MSISPGNDGKESRLEVVNLRKKSRIPSPKQTPYSSNPVPSDKQQNTLTPCRQTAFMTTIRQLSATGPEKLTPANLVCSPVFNLHESWEGSSKQTHLERRRICSPTQIRTGILLQSGNLLFSDDPLPATLQSDQNSLTGHRSSRTRERLLL